MNDFIAVIEELIQLFQELIQIEQCKLTAAEKKRITHIEHCINQEQAAVMKLRGLEKKRELCLTKLGFSGCSFQEILVRTSASEQSRLRPLFHTLSQNIRQFQDINESARTMIEVNLYLINKAISEHSKGGKLL